MNYIQLAFSFFITVIIVFGSLLNVFEDYLPIVFVQAFRYGKFEVKGRTKSKLVQELPKSYFRHFYRLALIIQTYVFYLVVSVYLFNAELPNWIEDLLNLSCGNDRTAHTNATKVFVATVLFTLQVYRRFYDTHFVSIFGKNSKINLGQYILGIVHYPFSDIAILCEAPKFALSDLEYSKVNLLELNGIEILSVIMFLWAWSHQHVCTKILANLRKNKRGDVVTDDHKLPQGDWFKYLSCPHQTAEILMYLSLTIILRHNITWFFVFGWVLSNQVETILLSHWWYQSHFDKFPRERKALIPFIY
ncbi:polyprenol reductase isoform X2 [Aethina tumida]|uniref:polyprenol reductase isoform X2 n=1 Tax=Aethina tumida TaxID=116153 RepID=UPI00096ADA22|nr:polyprenol reductase isoform X2 [Aethina tumida]